VNSDLDIYRTANVLVKHYGEDAAPEVAQRARSPHQFHEGGKVVGQAVGGLTFHLAVARQDALARANRWCA
jgi:hypothetical protein